MQDRVLRQFGAAVLKMYHPGTQSAEAMLQSFRCCADDATTAGSTIVTHLFDSSEPHSDDHLYHRSIRAAQSLDRNG